MPNSGLHTPFKKLILRLYPLCGYTHFFRPRLETAWHEEVREMRHWLTGAIAAAVLDAVPMAAAAQVSALPRTADGQPNLQGIWQVLNTAAWDIQDHQARLGVPAGQGVVECN